ncbi:pirin family protein [Brevundimonas sp. 2R-24]|uniref:Pirin family protein n=1 Tax=Peiella sedimenti TaxID=3061083 RepID=A0ABT8SMB1_9CAUL|nr:pirin family protein [Caulobacteraceae bacterium XZ-24]
MIDIRPFNSLGGADHGWLKAKHHFSFANYHDPSRMGWGALRVWNDDEIAAKSGFPPHPHADMEIITYVRTGAITHQDSMGNQGRTGAGDVQVMSAGTGVRHAEYNLEDETTTLFQIWIQTDRPGAQPSWGAKPFPKADRSGAWAILASGRDGDAKGDDGALPINTDARVLGATLKAGESLDYDLTGRRGYLVPATGAVEINGVRANARDGAAIAEVDHITVRALEDAELVMVDCR